MSNTHDVVIVGGGPAGCHAAQLLAGKGFDVHVFEEHSVIGTPVDCSGVVGVEAFQALGLSLSLRLAEINRLKLVSPSNLEVHFAPSGPLAYVVDRAGLDQVIAERATTAGANFHVGCRVADLCLLADRVEVCVSDGSADHSINRRVYTRVVILADGPRYKFQRKLGMGQPRGLLKTAQTEIPIKGIDETRVLMGSNVAPGSYGWIIPFERDDQSFARVGVSAKEPPMPYLQRLLHRLYSNGHIESTVASIRSWVIPNAPLRRTYTDRIVVVGDAAGQTKPITGGGIYYAIISAEAAAKAIHFAFGQGDFNRSTFRLYEHEWRRKLAREIGITSFFRRIAERLTDEEIDDLFRVTLSNGVLTGVTQKANFDWHRHVIYFAMRHPQLAKVLFKGLFR